MKKIVLVRHGKSVWNKDNRFTGWVDVDLSKEGECEALKAGKLLKENGYFFELAYTSYLKRAIKSLYIVLEEMDLMWIPVKKSWCLNERHYGSLQGCDKDEMKKKYGEEKMLLWRRSYNVSPPPLGINDERNPGHDKRYENLEDSEIPLTESLKDAYERIIPYWEKEILSSLKSNDQIIISAHGNVLRAIFKHVKGIGDEDIMDLYLKTAVPYVFEFDNNLILTNEFYIDK